MQAMIQTDHRVDVNTANMHLHVHSCPCSGLSQDRNNIHKNTNMYLAMLNEWIMLM